MKFLLIPIVAILTGLLSLPSHAGYTDSGRVTTIFYMPNGAVLFLLSVPNISPPACNTSRNRFAINGTTTAGKLQVAGLVTAYASGKSVTVHGTHGCTVWPDSETVHYIVNE